ncbi:MAG: hydantoinase B/oxoprolinase family protein, partial [Actinobacteria bacterium]|nr:hydantoinase B/oxoprolinase family protein [Actinomycetota bacterium]
MKGVRPGYRLLHPKCALTGRMIFPGDPFVKGVDGRLYVDEVAQRLAGWAGPIEDALDELGPWLQTAGLDRDPAADPITQEVVSGALTSIWVEMQLTMTRTAYSPVFFEGEDFTVSIFDADL